MIQCPAPPCSPPRLCASFKEVDHPCQQCGTTVEDGRPFCPQCRAPQIHVQVAIPEAGPAALNPEPHEPSPEIPLETRLASSKPRQTLYGGMMDRSIAVRAALKAGVLGMFIGIIPFLGIVLTGALAVVFYRRESGFVLPAPLASRLAGAAGVVSFAINALLIAIRILVFHAQREYTELILKIAQKFGANAADPDFQTTIHNLFTPSGLAIAFLFGMIFTVVLASVGGALASLFLRPRHPRT